MTSDKDEFIIGQRGQKMRILDLDKREEEKRKGKRRGKKGKSSK